MNWQNKKVLVAGLGGSGISMIAFLRQAGAEVAAYNAALKPERVAQIGKMFDGLKFYTGRLKIRWRKVSIRWPSARASASVSRILPDLKPMAAACWVTLKSCPVC